MGRIQAEPVSGGLPSSEAHVWRLNLQSPAWELERMETLLLDEFSVSLDPAAARLLEVRGRNDDQWRLFALPVSGPFTAAPAIEAGVTNILYFEMTEVESDE